MVNWFSVIHKKNETLYSHFSNPRLRGDGGPFHSHVFFIFILFLIDNLFIKCGAGGKKSSRIFVLVPVLNCGAGLVFKLIFSLFFLDENFG